MLKNKLIFIGFSLITVSLMIVMYLIIEELTIEGSCNKNKKSNKDEILSKNNMYNIYKESHRNRSNKNVNSTKKNKKENVNISKKLELSGYEYFKNIVCKKFRLNEFPGPEPYFENISYEELYERYIKGDFIDLKKIFNDKNISEIMKFALLDQLLKGFSWYKNCKDKNFVRLFKNFMNKYIAKIVMLKYEEGGAKFWGKTWKRYLFGIIGNLQSGLIKLSRKDRDIFDFRKVFCPILDKELKELETIEDFKNNKDWVSFLQIFLEFGGALAQKNLKRVLRIASEINKDKKKLENTNYFDEKLAIIIGQELDFTDPMIFKTIIDVLIENKPSFTKSANLFFEITHNFKKIAEDIMLKKNGFEEPCKLSKEFKNSFDKFEKLFLADLELYNSEKYISSNRPTVAAILLWLNKDKAFKIFDRFIKENISYHLVSLIIPKVLDPHYSPIGKEDVDRIINKINRSNSPAYIIAYSNGLKRIHEGIGNKKLFKKIQNSILGITERLLLDNSWLPPYIDSKSKDKNHRIGKYVLLEILSYFGDDGSIDAIKKWHNSLKFYKDKHKDLYDNYNSFVRDAIKSIKERDKKKDGRIIRAGPKRRAD